MKSYPETYQVVMTVRAAEGAKAETVRSLIRDLEWVGGCRHPDEDPGFHSLRVSNIKITRAAKK